MADTAAPRKRLTVQEFLDWEDRQPTKHELFDGVVRAMAGGTRNHNTIAGNIFAALHSRLSGRPCEAFTSDMKTKTEEKDVYYPDVTVDCGQGPGTSLPTIEPTVIFEVLSKSTRKADLVEKLRSYQATASIRQIVYAEQDQKKLHMWRRTGERWSDVEEIGPEGALYVDLIDSTLSFAEIYARVDFAS